MTNTKVNFLRGTMFVCARRRTGDESDSDSVLIAMQPSTILFTVVYVEETCDVLTRILYGNLIIEIGLLLHMIN